MEPRVRADILVVWLVVERSKLEERKEKGAAHEFVTACTGNPSCL